MSDLILIALIIGVPILLVVAFLRVIFRVDTIVRLLKSIETQLKESNRNPRG